MVSISDGSGNGGSAFSDAPDPRHGHASPNLTSGKLPESSLVRTARSKGFEYLNDGVEPDTSDHVIYLRHSKSGARAVLIQTSDPLLRFELRFRSLPEDSTGVFHVLEHAVISRPGIVSVADPFSEALKSLRIIDANASTYPDYTQYYTAGLDRASVEIMARLYTQTTLAGAPSMDVVMRERGHLAPDSDSGCGFKYTGVVYNEMLGKLDALLRDMPLKRSIFRSGPFHHTAGGDPNDIVELTESQIKIAYESTYSTSNAVFGLYGNTTVDDKLTLLDELLSNRTEKCQPQSFPPLEKGPSARAEITVVPFDPQSGPITKQFQLSLNWLFPRVTDYQEKLELNVLRSLLDAQECSPFNQEYRVAKIENRYDGCYLDTYGDEDKLEFKFKDSEEKDLGLTKERTLELLTEFARNGFSKEAIHSLLKVCEKRNSETITKADRAKDILSERIDRALRQEYTVDTKRYAERIQMIREKLDRGEKIFEDLLKKYILNNPNCVEVTLKPSAEVGKDWELSHKRKLEEVVNNLSNEQRDAAIKDANRMVEMAKVYESAEALAKFPKSTLPDELRKHIPVIVMEEKYQGATLTFQPQDTKHQAAYALKFDISDIPPAEMGMVRFLGDVINTVGTHSMPSNEFIQKLNSLSGGVSFGTETVGVNDPETSTPKAVLTYLEFKGQAQVKSSAKLLEYLGDMLVTPRLDDVQAMARLVDTYRAGIISILNHPRVLENHTLMRLAATANSIGEHRLAQGTEMDLIALNKFSEGLKKNPGGFVEELRALHKKVFTRQRLIGSVTVNTEDQESVLPSLKALVDRLPDGEKVGAISIGTFAPSRIGLITELQNNFVGMSVGLFDANGSRWNRGGVAAVGNAIVNRHLEDRIRNLGMAYGASCFFNSDTAQAVFHSERDPNISKTITAFKESVEFLRKASEDLLDRAKVEAIRPYDSSNRSPSDWGNVGVYRKICQLSASYLDNERTQVFDATLDDMSLYANALEEGIMRNDISIVVYGNKNALENARNEGVELDIIDRSQAEFPRRS